MIFGHLNELSTYDFLLVKPGWKEAFEWLGSIPLSASAGIVKLRGDDLYASIQRHNTVPREQCRFETHRRYIDLQYCISGGEFIGWNLASALRLEGSFDEKSDVQFYAQPAESTPLRMTTGYFAVFFPADAHAPKEFDGAHHSVFKVVVKIDHSLVFPPRGGAPGPRAPTQAAIDRG